MKENETNKPTVVKRRTIAKGAAWSIPAVATVAAAPLAAASIPAPEPGDICKESGQYYRIYVTSATVGSTVTFTFELATTDIFFSDASGVTFELCGLTATATDLTYDESTLTYTLQATVSDAESFPFVVIGNVNIDTSGTRYIDITENGLDLAHLESNFGNCSPNWNKSPYTCDTSSTTISLP